MALLMAARHPEIWAGVSAWAGISDLPAWYAESFHLNQKYSTDISNNCGGIPDKDAAHAQFLNECLHRSSITYFPNVVAQLPPLDINAGIEDGHTNVPFNDGNSITHKMYAVPIRHTLNVFNLVASSGDILTPEQVDTMVGSQNGDYSTVGSIRPELASQGPWPDSFYDNAAVDTATYKVAHMDKHVLFRRQSGNVRLTIFNGNHEILYWAALDWLSRQWKP